MQRKKNVIACLSLLLVGLALSAAPNKAHAFTSGKNSFAISNILTNFSSPSGVGSGTVAQGGTTISVTVTLQGSTFNNPAYQRNVTVGYKGDWMSSYQNASILTLTTGQIASTSISIALPSANAALATAYNLSGGQGNAVIISPILQAVGTVMFGLGGLLAGLGGFFYLRRRPKA